MQTKVHTHTHTHTHTFYSVIYLQKTVVHLVDYPDCIGFQDKYPKTMPNKGKCLAKIVIGIGEKMCFIK